MSQSSNNKRIAAGSDLQPRNIPVQKRSEKTVAQILKVSAELLDEVGFDRFNTNLLAERADLRVATVYRYFPNKLAILSALIQGWLDLIKKELSFWEDIADPERDWRKIFTETIDKYHTLAKRHPGFTTIRRAMQSVPELRASELEFIRDLAVITVKGMKTRGVKNPGKQLFTVAGLFMMTTASGYDLVWLVAKDDETMQAEIIDELKLNAISYLANYLD